LARKKRWKPARLARQALAFVLSGLALGFLIIHFERLLGLYIPKHLAVSVGVGAAVAIVLWVLRLAKHPPMFIGKVPPLAAGFCAGLGVHLSRLWLH
jgi:hypothetical protein